MARFKRVADENFAYLINLDQIAFMRRAPNDNLTEIVFAGDKEQRLFVPSTPEELVRD